MSRVLLIFSVLLCVCALFYLQHQPENHLISPIFEAADGDHNGVISEEEYQKVGDPSLDFSVLDTDGDGALSPSEVEASIRLIDPAWAYRDPS
jgi:Ca2+-binding EF-hand superfamily protein